MPQGTRALHGVLPRLAALSRARPTYPPCPLACLVGLALRAAPPPPSLPSTPLQDGREWRGVGYSSEREREERYSGPTGRDFARRSSGGVNPRRGGGMGERDRGPGAEAGAGPPSTGL